ncbi:sigma-70 family RNA polymerase sigma factor [Flammeovirga yaeyamensis]|uniref:Sigma-70 family RNA polymerase sigma factor n=1 Tax=Flammeovirga yaeyamensis TaxID=367791 RepID=A0AAX1N405_9BACT|nr:sigma-70 family RNA polymerase sigma factor [Flammeovirga yaeyamensis]MBB3700999.1 RNA polymerase sigma-70 factor (ECF subfamily) [Flammeovirga yaeyamensis]NMF38167.1 sigma-70 family RNA polymerase sigma factor [Flammeovirga yaeyamensis]QWG01937.1 sigma-70 family RNA polymerase sigma factor [Flammeovirga yaeyamensis]
MKFEEIYQNYWQKVFRLAMGYVNDHDLAKDLTQDVFIIVYQKLSTFNKQSSIGTWIFRIASNTCLRSVEKRQKQQTTDLPQDLSSSENQFEDNDQIKFLYQCISTLSEIDRLIISLELEEVPQNEIAEIVGISNGNVRTKIHRIKEKLNKKMLRYEYS